MNDTKPRATSRTWQTMTEMRPFGENWDSVRHTVTLTRTPVGLVGEVDGEVVEAERAVRIVHTATTRTVTAETLETDPTAAFVYHGAHTRSELHRLIEQGMSAWNAIIAVARAARPLVS